MIATSIHACAPSRAELGDPATSISEHPYCLHDGMHPLLLLAESG
jgi:hypothetical protein